MRIERTLRRVVVRGSRALWPAAIFASLADAAVLWGLKDFLSKLNQHGHLLWWSLAMIAMVAIRFGALLWKQHSSEGLSRWVEAYLRIWQHQIIPRLPASYFHHTDSDDALRRSQESARTLVGSVDAGTQALQATLQLMVFLPVLFYISTPLTVGLLLGMLPLLAWIQRYLRRLSKGMDARIQAQGHLDGLLVQWGNLVRHWTLNADLHLQTMRFSQDVQSAQREGKILGVRKGLLVQVADATAALVVIGVLAVCAWWMQHGGMRGTDLILYAAALVLGYKPVKECLRVVPVLREAGLALQHLKTMEDYALLNKNRKQLKGKEIERNTPPYLLISNVDFSYQSVPPKTVFSQWSMQIPITKPVWLRGPNGCGKTTLLRLLAGLEQVDAGEIQWVGLGEAAQPAFLSHKGIMPAVSDFTLMQSVSPMQKLLVAQLGVQGFIGREGLSAGQRQRLGIAWLFCSAAKILILDEPLSFIAQKDREPILQAMLACAKEQGIWFILASHDVVTQEIMREFVCIEVALP